MSIAVIINPVSGRARGAPAPDRVSLARAVAGQCGEPAEVVVTERPGHARELAAALASRVRLVIAWGGDGTVNEVASALAFGPVPLGIVPSGSGNGLARELGIPRDPAAALRRAMTAAPMAADLGEVGGRLFINVAGIGIDAYVARAFSAPGHSRGPLGYLRLGAQALISYAPAEYVICADGERFEARAVLVVFANSAQYGNGARIAPAARLDDGELDLVVVEERSRLATICRTPHLFRGTVSRIPGWSTRRFRRASVEAAEPMLFHVDGEPLRGGTLLHARVHPQAIGICR